MNHMLGYNISNACRKRRISIAELSRRIRCDRASLGKRINEPWRFTIEEIRKSQQPLASIGVSYWRVSNDS